MKFDILTLFPDMVMGVLNESIIGRAQDAGHIEIHAHNIRDFSTNKHRKTDDTPYGGGMGMLMTCQPIFDCFADLKSKISKDSKTRVIYMSPKGKKLTQQRALELSKSDILILKDGIFPHQRYEADDVLPAVAVHLT